MNANRSIIRNAILVGVLIIVIPILVFLAAPSSILVSWVSDGLPLLLAVSGALLAFRIYRMQGANKTGNRIWGSMTLGLTAFAIGESLWTFYDLVLQEEVPYPSVADVAWVLAYIPLFIAIGSQFLSLRVALSRPRKLLIALLSLAMIAFTFWMVILPIFGDPESGTPAEMFFSIAYPVEDTILFAIGTALVLVFLGGQLALPWGAISLGILLLSVSDLLFSYGTWNNLYYPNGELNLISAVFDTLYISAYMVWNIGLFLRWKLPEPGRDLDIDQLVQKEDRTPVEEKGKSFLMMTDTEGSVVFIDSALVKILGLRGAGEGMGQWYGDLIGLNRQSGEEALRQARKDGISKALAVTPGQARDKYSLRVAASSAGGKLPGFDILLHPEAQLIPAEDGREAFLLGQIVHHTQAQEDLAQSAGEERMLRIYFNSIMVVLDAMLSRTGGVGVSSAFEKMVNQKAGSLARGFALQKGQATWSQKKIDPVPCRTLLEEAVQYAKEVVQPATVDRTLGEIEKHLDSKIVQAAMLNNLRIRRSSGD